MPKKIKHSHDSHESTLANDTLWGVRAIAKHIKRSVRTTRYLIEIGVLPIQKLGARTILGRKSKIDKVLTGENV